MNRRFLLLGVLGAMALALVPPPASATVGLDVAIVTFDAPPTADDLETLGGVAAAVHGFAHVPAAVVHLDPLDLSVLRRLPGVRTVVPNTTFRPLLAQSTSTLGADRAWVGEAIPGVTGEGIGVAIIDTGIDGTHPDLCAAPEFCRDTAVKTVQNVKILGRETVADPVVILEDQISTDTSSGHGSHVASIAAGYGVAGEHATYRGVAPGARLIGLGTGELIEAVNVLAAFDWVIEHADDPRYNIKAVNNSWGTGPGWVFDPEHPVNRAIQAAHDAGITVVFGAGNDGPATDVMNAFSAHPKAISVAAGTKDGHISFFSSRGVPGSDFWRPTVTAPGSNITAARASTGFLTHVADALAPNPDPVLPPDNLYYANSNGTSMAAPHIAGVVALMQEAAHRHRGRYLTPDEVADILQATATTGDPARPGGLPNYQHYTMGAGYADALRAVEAAANGHVPAAGTVYDVQGFEGEIGLGLLIPTSSFTSTFEVAGGATSLDVMVDWATPGTDIDIDLHRPDGTLAGATFLRCNPADEPNGYSSFCTSQPNERHTVANPIPGTWQVVVKGTISVAETVSGVWSAAYPPSATPPAPQTPAAVTVQTTLPLAVAGTEVEFVATVRDAAGHPVPASTVTWAVTGAGTVVAADQETRSNGTATAVVQSSVPGRTQVTAQAGDATGTATVDWLGLGLGILGQNTPGEASGGGWFTDGDRWQFGFHAGYSHGAAEPGGELVVNGPAGAIRSTAVRQFTVTGQEATVRGDATLNGTSGYQFRLTVTDAGEPGRGADTVRLEVTQLLDPLFRLVAEGVLGGGNVQVRSH